MPTPRRALTLTAFALALLPAGIARAGGLEVPENGTVALGRGGAYMARASDPLAMVHNVAGIVGLDGVQVTLSSNFGFFSNCFQRSGTYDSAGDYSIDTSMTVFQNSTYANGGVAYPETCRDNNVNLGPQLLATYRIRNDLAVGLGIYGPNASGAIQNFPETVMTADGQLAPSPARYMLYEKNLFLVYPTLSVAYAPIPWLRFGVGLQPSWARFQFGTMVNTNPLAAQSPTSDLKLSLDGSGFFFAGMFAVQAIPSPYLSIAAQIHANTDLNLSGTGHTISHYYWTDASQRPESDIVLTNLHARLPLQARLGVRFAMPLAGHPRQGDPITGAQYDPMADDRFDVELDATYENTSSLGTTTVAFTGTIRIDPMGTSANAPAMQVTESGARDTYGIRLGGDVNIVPNLFAARLGIAYETGSQSTELAQIHLPSYDTLSVHGGVSVRWRYFTLNLGYAHYFMQELDALDGRRPVTGAMGPVTQSNCDTPGGPGPGACMVNRGVYHGSLDTLGVGITAHF